MLRMERHQLQNVIDSITLPAGWHVRILTKGDGYLLQIVFTAPDSDTGVMTEQRCRKWYVSPYSTITEIVRTVHKAGLAAIEHEFDEQFKYRGIAVFHPHRSLESLLAGDGEYDRRDRDGHQVGTVVV